MGDSLSRRSGDSLRAAASQPNNMKQKVRYSFLAFNAPLIKRFSNSITNRFPPELFRIAANVGWLTIARVLQMGVNALVGVWFARYLGPELYGIYSYALAFVVLLGVLASMGLQGIVVRDVVRDPGNKETILGTTFVLKLLGGILSTVIIILGIVLTHPNDRLIISLVIILAVQTIFQAFGTIDLWFQARVQAKYVVWARSSALMLGAIAKVVLILVKAPLIMFAWVVIFEAILIAAGLVIAYQVTGYSLAKWRANLTMARNMLGQSWILILSGIGVVIYLKVDQLMIAEMMGAEELGIYSAAVQLSELWYFIPTFIAASVFPAMIISKDLGEDIYQARLQQLYDLMAWLSLSLAIPITFLSDNVIALLYGEAYKGAGTILAIHIWASVFVFFGRVLSKWLINEGLLTFSPMRHGFGAIINIGLNWFLIPVYGGIGAAIATVISYAVASYFACFLYPRTRSAGKMMTLALVVHLRAIHRGRVA